MKKKLNLTGKTFATSLISESAFAWSYGVIPKAPLRDKGENMASENVKLATDSNFEAEILKSGTPALVDFWAVWCGPCRALAPTIDELANDNKGKINVFKLNVDENPDIAARFGIRGIPTVLMFKNGQVAEQSVGVGSKADLQKLINKLL